MAGPFADTAVSSRRTARAPETSALAALAGAGALAAAAALDPADIDSGPVLCPFRLLTGLPCPGCGLTRSWVHLVHGGWSEGLSANPFGAVSLVAVLAFVVAVAVAAVRRTPLPDVGRLVTSRALLVVGALWIGYGIGRLGWLLLIGP